MTRQARPPYLRRYDLGKGKQERIAFELALIMMLLNEGVTPNCSKEQSAELRKELGDYLDPIIDRSGSAANSIRRLLQRINSLRMMPEWILEKPARSPKYSERFLTLDGEKFFVRMATNYRDNSDDFYYQIILRSLINGTLTELHRCKKCSRVFQHRQRTEFCSPNCSHEWFAGHAAERKRNSRENRKGEKAEMEAAVKMRAGRELFEEIKRLSSKRELSNQELEYIKRFRSRYGPTTPVAVEKDWDKLDKRCRKHLSDLPLCRCTRRYVGKINDQPTKQDR